MTSPPKNEALIKVIRTDLPLRCPRPDATLWNAHPHVYPEADKPAKCPYYGASYVLTA